MRLLVLGGTRFVGRHIVEAALANGHAVTIVHRGRSGAELFGECQHVIADRDEDLSALTGREFDATIDAASRHGAVPAVVTTSACNRVVAGFDTATASQRRADVDALADSYATTKRPGVSAADLAAVFCPGGRPAPVVDGVRVLDGSGKLTKAGAITMWKRIAATTSVSR